MNRVAEFVERELPERYAALCEANTQARPPVIFGLHVQELHTWSLAAHADHLQVQQALDDNRVLTVSLSEPDFERLVLDQLTLFEQGAPMIAPRALRWDDETRRLITAMPGSILVRIADQEATRKVWLTPGLRSLEVQEARCTIDCELGDLMAVKAGSQQVMELFLAGKLRIDGDVQLALALAGVLM
jgi:hypothetical protein